MGYRQPGDCLGSARLIGRVNGHIWLRIPVLFYCSLCVLIVSVGCGTKLLAPFGFMSFVFKLLFELIDLKCKKILIPSLVFISVYRACGIKAKQNWK